MPPAPTDMGRGRRAIAAGFVATVLLAVAGYAAAASVATNRVLVARQGALLAAPPSDATARVDPLSDATLARAVAATPLDQRVANVAMVRDVREKGAARTAPWLALLGRMGWRDTPAVQNMLYAAAGAGDLARILDLGDSLMRRQQLNDQMIAVLLAVESDPCLLGTFAGRLAGRPNWRPTYLTATGQLQRREQLLTRFALLLALQRARAGLTADELVPNIAALDRADLPQYGFALWQGMRPRVTRPLDDTGFALASRSYAAGNDPVPYQWRMMTGQGFSADASEDGGRGLLTIDWDGRGVPVFAEQRTSALPGRYALDVTVASEDVADLSAIAFRLVCGARATPFRATAGAPMRLVTDGAVPCAYPVLQLVGALQPGATAHQIAFQRIAMRPLAPAMGT